MKSARKDRARLIGKKFSKLNRRTRRKIYFIELLLRQDDKYWDSSIKHFIFYGLWTRKTRGELEKKLEGLDVIIESSEKFIEEYYQRLKAWI